MRRSKDVVWDLFRQGRADKLVAQIECNSVAEEVELSDTFTLGLPLEPFSSYMLKGGPLRRQNEENLIKWIERISKISIDLPSPDDVADKLRRYVDDVVSRYRLHDRFITLKITGPLEACESVFSSGVPRGYEHYEQIGQRFYFALLLRLDKTCAHKIYDEISKYVISIAASLLDLDYVDAIRISDDMADYRGLLYPREFVEQKCFTWYREFSASVTSKGRIPLLHTDGNVVGVLEELSRTFRGVHPLDVTRRSTVSDCIKWVNELASLRERLPRSFIFITGIPIELVFNDDVSPDEFLKFMSHVIKMASEGGFLLSTTHRPPPRRSYAESTPREKIVRLRRVISR